MGGATVKLSDFAAYLSHLDVRAVARAAMAAQAEAMAEQVRGELDHAKSANETFPARETGALLASICVYAEDDVAVIGSLSDVAVYQEFGTAHVPPRPFLAPVAAAGGEAAAHAVGAAVADAVRGV
jgi:phage gpG-like protein